MAYIYSPYTYEEVILSADYYSPTVGNNYYQPTVGNNYYSPVWSDTSEIIFSDAIHSPTSDIILTPNNYYNTKKPSIVTMTSPSYLSPDQPITTSVRFDYSQPLVGIYQDLNTDPYAIAQIVNYFHKLTLDKWLFGELIDIINYFKIDGKGNVDIITSMKSYESKAYKKYSVSDMEKIVDFIEKYFLSKRVIKKVLAKYVAESGTEWVKLPRNKYFIRQLVSNKIMKLIKQAFVEKAKN